MGSNFGQLWWVGRREGGGEGEGEGGNVGRRGKKGEIRCKNMRVDGRYRLYKGDFVNFYLLI